MHRPLPRTNRMGSGLARAGQYAGASSCVRRFSGRLLAAAGIAAARLPAQPHEAVQIAGAVACSTCGVITERIGTLTPPDGFSFSRTPVALDSAGRTYVAAQDGFTILVFDRNGRYEARFGSRGDGPGELQRVGWIAVGPGDSLYVFDGRGRMSIFSPSHRFVRAAQFPPGSLHDAFVTGHDIVAHASIGTGQLAGYVIHVFDALGGIRKSLGRTDQPTLDPRCRLCSDQIVAPGPTAGSAWIAPLNRYVIQLWRTDGTVRRTAAVTGADWFVDWNAVPNFLDGSQPRHSVIEGIFNDSSGYTWVSGLHAPTGWKPRPVAAMSGVRAVGGGAIRARTTADLVDFLVDADTLLNETVLDVIDLLNRRIVARARIPGTLRLLNSRRAYRVYHDANGEIVIDLYALSLRR